MHSRSECWKNVQISNLSNEKPLHSIAAKGNSDAYVLVKNQYLCGLKSAKLSERLALYRVIIKQGEDARAALSSNFDTLELDDAELSDILALCSEIASYKDQAGRHLRYKDLGLTKHLHNCKTTRERLGLLQQLTSFDWYSPIIGWKYFAKCGFVNGIKNCKTFEERLSSCNAIATQEWATRPMFDIHFNKLGFIEDVKNSESYEERLARCDTIASQRWYPLPDQKSHLLTHFEDLGFIKDILTYQGVENRLALFDKILSQKWIRQKWISDINFDKCYSQLGVVKEIRACKSLEERVQLCQKIDPYMQYNSCLLTDFHELGFIEDVKSYEDVSTRLALYRSLGSQLGELITEAMVMNWKKLGLQDAPTSQQIAFCKWLARQGAYTAEKMVMYFSSLGLKKAPLADRFDICREIARQGDCVLDDLIYNINKLGKTDKDRRQILIELLTPPSTLDYFFEEDCPFSEKIAPLGSILVKIQGGKPLEEADFIALEKFVKDSPVEALYEKIKTVKNPWIHRLMIQWAAYCSSILFDQTEDRVNIIKESGILHNIYTYKNPLLRIAFTRQLSLMNTESLEKITTEAGTRKYSKLCWILLSRMKQIGFTTMGLKAIFEQFNKVSGFKDQNRFGTLANFFLQVIEKRPYTPDEIQITEQAILAALSMKQSETTGDKKIIHLVTSELKMLTNILQLFGKEEFFRCLKSGQSFQSFFQEQFQILFEVEKHDDFGDRYEKTFGRFRDDTAIFTYLSRVNRLPLSEKDEVKDVLNTYVNAVLNEEFPAIRYDENHNPHLKVLFNKQPELKELWIDQAEPKEIIQTKSRLPHQTNYKEFFTQKIVTDHHLAPDEYPQLCDYLSGKATTFDEQDDPKKVQFQTLAIDLCEGKIKGEDFVSQVKKLALPLGEFQNDLNGLIPKQIFGKYTISESDDPCDLQLSGTEIKNSCQRVSGYPDLNKCLASYLVNGEIKPIVVKVGGKLVARSMLRLMWDKKNQTPVILQERIYSNVNDPAINEAIQTWAVEKAKKMGIPLVSKEVGKGNRYGGTVQFLGGFAPFTYSDASGGILKGPFETKACHVLYSP